MTLEQQLALLGTPVPRGDLRLPRAIGLASYVAPEDYDDAQLVECRQRLDDGTETVIFDLRVETPQDLAAPIRRVERLAAAFRADDRGHPHLFAVRGDFPDTPHQNAVPPGCLRYPCVDDRPWSEARASWTPLSFVNRVRSWMAAAACGALTDDVQAVDPLFVSMGPDISVPRSVFDPDRHAGAMVLHAATTDTGDVGLYHLRPSQGIAADGSGTMHVLTVRLPPQSARGIRLAPRNLAELVVALDECGCDLVEVLREAAREVLAPPFRYAAFVALLVVTRIARRDGGPVAAEDLKAFYFERNLGELGERVGAIYRNPDFDPAKVSSESRYGRLLPPTAPTGLGEVGIQMLSVHLDFDRELGRQCSGARGSDTLRVVLVGAGAVGSHLANALSREGRFRWTIVDDDILLPHNLARHVLLPCHLGHAKALALAGFLSNLLGEHDASRGIRCNALHPGAASVELDAALDQADVVIDASASVAVSRHLSDATWMARRASVFLNPIGAAAVLLVEDKARGCRLDALEGQYYRLVLRTPDLTGHLAPPAGGLRYTGACRHVTNRIPETHVAILTGAASLGLSRATMVDAATIRIWNLDADGRVTMFDAVTEPSRRFEVGDWTIVYDDGLVGHAREARLSALPAETGGVLVGVVDVGRKTIVVVDALDPPLDSRGSETGFERGIVGIKERLQEVNDATSGQVRYVGEWHTHPRGHDARPSMTDLEQLMGLQEELRREGIPPVMLIIGEHGPGIASTLPVATA